MILLILQDKSNLTVNNEATQAEDTDGITQDENTDVSITTDELAETGDLIQDISWVNIEETKGFNQVHYCLFNTINTWAIQETVKNHPFYQKWRRAIYAGLTALTQWGRIAKIFQLTYLQDYINLMNECPAVRERYELSWDYFENTVKCKEIALPHTEDVLRDITKINHLQGKLQQLAYTFESRLTQFNSRLGDTDDRITSCEMKITSQLNRVTSKFAASVTQHYNFFRVCIKFTGKV
jgi:hypothetical protein